MTAPTLPAVEFDAAEHRYTRDGVTLPNVTGILQAVGLSTDWSQQAPSVQATAEAKRDLGAHVHQACALHDKGSLSWGTLDDQIFPYVEAWERYVAQRHIVEWLLIEEPLAHSTLGYAGTPDRLGRTNDGTLVLVDAKCGDPDDAGGRFQLAGYALLIDDAGLAPVRKQVRECVQLRPDGTFRVHVYNDARHDCAVWRAALTVYPNQIARRATP